MAEQGKTEALAPQSKGIMSREISRRRLLQGALAGAGAALLAPKLRLGESVARAEGEQSATKSRDEYTHFVGQDRFTNFQSGNNRDKYVQGEKTDSIYWHKILDQAETISAQIGDPDLAKKLLIIKSYQDNFYIPSDSNPNPDDTCSNDVFEFYNKPAYDDDSNVANPFVTRVSTVSNKSNGNLMVGLHLLIREKEAQQPQFDPSTCIYPFLEGYKNACKLIIQHDTIQGMANSNQFDATSLKTAFNDPIMQVILEAESLKRMYRFYDKNQSSIQGLEIDHTPSFISNSLITYRRMVSNYGDDSTQFNDNWRKDVRDTLKLNVSDTQLQHPPLTLTMA